MMRGRIVAQAHAWTPSGGRRHLRRRVRAGTIRIRGLARHARDTGVEVILDANTREASLEQYTSMVLEKTIADAVPDRPELPPHSSSSELVFHPLAPGLSPTCTHGAITHGLDRVNQILLHARAS